VRRKLSAVAQGKPDMLILKTLALETMHGYGIGLRVEQISKGVFQIHAGSLIPGFRAIGAATVDRTGVALHRE
jgi:PadR family transcriptional regulator, regulatory protein PadR